MIEIFIMVANGLCMESYGLACEDFSLLNQKLVKEQHTLV